MKKLLLIAILMLALVFTIAACTGGETPDDTTVDDTTVETPTDAPTEEPTDAPTEEPTDAPTEEPTDAPTEEPTEAPTDEPAPDVEPTVVLDKTEYAYGESIMVSATGSNKDWVGIVIAGTDYSLRWWYVDAVGSGVAIDVLNDSHIQAGTADANGALPAGEYEVVWVANDSTIVDAAKVYRYKFTVKDPHAPAWIVGAEQLNELANVAGASNTSAELKDGYISLTAKGGDPWFMAAGNLGEMPEYLAIRYRTNASQGGEIFIGNGAGPVGGESFLFTYNANSEWNVLIFHLPTVASYMATPSVGYIRFDYYTGGPDEGFLDVAYMGFFNSVEDVQKYDFEMYKAPMWDADKEVVAHQSFDQFFYGDGNQDDAVNNNLNLYHAANKPDWDFVADMVGSEYTCLTYWGWVATKADTIGQFGYQVGMNAPIFDDAWTHATEQGVLDAAVALGGVTGSRMKIRIDTTDFDGETVVRVLYKDADGNVVCLNEVTVIAPEKAKDITDTFTSDVNANEVGTTMDASDLANFFVTELPLAGSGVEANGEGKLYHLTSINDMYADVNGRYFIKANVIDSDANAWMFARGYKVVNSDEVVEKFDPAGGVYKINNYYETDSAGAMGGAGIYARLQGGSLFLMIKYYNSETVTRVGNKMLSIEAAGSELTLADDGSVVSILVDGVVYATVELSGSKAYEDINEVIPAGEFAEKAVITLKDGTVETIENTLIAATCQCQVGIVARAGSFKFDSLAVGGYSAIEIPDQGTEEPEEPQNVVIDLSTIEGYLATNNYGYNGPIVEIGYDQVYLLGEYDLSKYSQIIIEYSYDGDSVTDRTPEQCWTDCSHTPIIGFTALNKCFGYANVVNQDAIDYGVYTEMPHTPGNWSAATRTATIELPADIGYAGPCYLSAFNPWGRVIAVASITLVPRA